MTVTTTEDNEVMLYNFLEYSFVTLCFYNGNLYEA